MEIRVNKTFLKELVRIPANQRKKIEQFVFSDARAFEKQEDIPNLRKLKGYKYFYRIRFGNYRTRSKNSKRHPDFRASFAPKRHL